MRTRTLTLALAVALSSVAVLVATPGTGTPVFDTEATYIAAGRVFPDPHGCVRGQPDRSPWAKGSVCAAQFIQWNEALSGLRFLQGRFPDLIELIDLHERLAGTEGFEGLDMLSAGLPREDTSRDRKPLIAVKLTDARSPVPERDRKHFVYSLSIHGIERAGIEGGLRAAEDLVTWAACERDANAAPACAVEGPFPKRILEPSDSGPTAGEVLRDGVIYMVLANPDGWARGDVTAGGVSYQRYNGNGMDLNRDWPTIGYTERAYTPWSEPETRGFGRFLEQIRDRTSEKRFAGGIDLHGMANAPSFSYTLLGAGQRDYRKNALTVDTAIRTFRDSEARLSWSPLIAPAGNCPNDGSTLGFVKMCADQWGTVWDTIDYTITGGFGDWMDSPLGLDGIGIDNEMALSHIVPNTVFDAQIEQLHIDGNKGLIYSQIASLIHEQPVRFRTRGRVAYVHDPKRIKRSAGLSSPAPDLPPQEGFEHLDPAGINGFEFEVKGPSDGVLNGGLSVEATFANARGNSAATWLADIVLDFCGVDHPGEPAECREVARYFNQSPAYMQAGARIDLNDPKPGPYRVRASNRRMLPTRLEVSFSSGRSFPVPDQRAYDVSRMDFFTDLDRYAVRGSELTPLSVGDVLEDPTSLRAFDTIVAANDLMPGRWSDAQQRQYARALAAWVRGGGNLVLTDAAMSELPRFVRSLEKKVARGVQYAGWMGFRDDDGPTYDHPLARNVDKEGSAVGDSRHRRQTYEPVPLGYRVDPLSFGSCNQDQCDSPNWVVDLNAWRDAGGTVAALTSIRTTSGSTSGASLGELRLGRGRLRIAGALLPDPTQSNYHPYGLASYALTYTGYQVIENLIDWRDPRRVESAEERVTGDDERDDDARVLGRRHIRGDGGLGRTGLAIAGILLLAVMLALAGVTLRLWRRPVTPTV